MAIFGECLNYQSGLQTLIWAPKMFFWSQSLAFLTKVTTKKDTPGAKKNKIISRHLCFKHSLNMVLFTTFSEILAKSLVIFGLRDGWQHQNG